MGKARAKEAAALIWAACLACGIALSQLSADFRYRRGPAVVCRPISLMTREVNLASGAHFLPPLEAGDILLTFSTHTLGWRHGHAGLVIDGEQGLVLEAIQPGTSSCLMPAERWTRYADVQVLRLRDASPEIRRSVADFAMDKLHNLPYRLSSGLWGRELEAVSSVHCAYLVWRAYAQFGYDLDSDGGLVVTVGDLAASHLLEPIYRAP